MFSNFAELDLAAMPSLAAGAVRAHRVPLVAATAETLRGYGHIVPDFAPAHVTIVTWPQPGSRPIVPGTGNEGGIVQDSFTMQRHGEIQHAVNSAVGRSYITGWFTDPATASPDRQPTDTSRCSRLDQPRHSTTSRAACTPASPSISSLSSAATSRCHCCRSTAPRPQWPDHGVRVYPAVTSVCAWRRHRCAPGGDGGRGCPHSTGQRPGRSRVTARSAYRG
jgi:hypothetical protein